MTPVTAQYLLLLAQLLPTLISTAADVAGWIKSAYTIISEGRDPTADEWAALIQATTLKHQQIQATVV